MYQRIKILLSIIALALCAGDAAAIEIISGPYIQNVGENEATIIWRTDKNATAWVEIAPDDDTNFYTTERPRHYATDLGRALTGTLHKVHITNLEPGTKYRYRIFSEEVLDQTSHHVNYGGVASTDVYRKAPLEFRTTDKCKTVLDAVIVNDIHGDNELLSDLLAGVGKDNTDFVFFDGDMVSYMDSEQQVFDGFLNRSCDLFASEIPFYMARGNHETRGQWAGKYMDYFPTSTGKPYYAFSKGPVFFIVLDGGEDKPDSDIEYSRTAFFDNYRRDEAEWLADIVKTEEFKSAKYRIAVMHVPPVQDKWHGPMHVKQLFLPILNSAGIDLMLCGHLHHHYFLESGTDGAQFPILINSNKEAAILHADDTHMTLTTKDREGKEIKRWNFTGK